MLVIFWVAVGILISIVHEKGQQSTCLNHVRQIAAAVQQYTQDNNGRYPSHPWTTAVLRYLPAGSKTFACPADRDAEKKSRCSYGYNGLLMRLDRSGCNEAQLNSPIDIPLLCDAAPSLPIGQGSYIPGAGLLPEEHSAVPVARHHQGIVLGYCDGHADWYISDGNTADFNDPVTKGFYASLALGMISNPEGGLPASAALPDDKYQFPMPSIQSPISAFAIGGEYHTCPLILSLAELWKFKGYAHNPSLEIQMEPGILGELYYSRNLTLPSDFLWGSTIGTPGADPTMVESEAGKQSGIPIAHDALVFIVSKKTKIAANPVGGLTTVKNNSSPNNGWCCCNTATIAAWFTTDGGLAANQWQAYTYGTGCSTLSVAYHYLGLTAPKNGTKWSAVNPSPQAIVCYNDNDMVDKVANDPYGIGYCSSAFVDYDHVQPIGLVDASCEGGQGYWPNADAKHRTCLPNPYPGGGPNAGRKPGTYRWPAPLMRTLYVYARGDGSLLAKHADILHHSPMFKCSYW